MVFSAATVWLVTTNFIGYYQFEVVTQTEIINERPTEFPTVTICNNNPFTTKIAQDLVRNVLTIPVQIQILWKLVCLHSLKKENNAQGMFVQFGSISPISKDNIFGIFPVP